MSTTVSFLRCFLIVAMLLFSLSCMAQARDAAAFFPETEDPFMGNWKGRWSAEEDVNPDIAAQVIARGRNRYEIRIVSKLFMRCPPLAQFEVEPKGDTITFSEAGIRGKIQGGLFTGSQGKKTFEMRRYVHEIPTLGAPPPEGALVLFDGSNFDQWEAAEGWEILEDGVALVTPTGKYLVSKGRFRDVKLHVEFMLPLMPTARGQQRGNSGVFLQDKYEVQILDSFGLEGYYDECGALYKVAAPMVNACLPPLVWQAYDIEYRAPRFDEAGNLLAYPRMTVYHNGVLIHNDQEMPQITAWKERERLEAPPREPGPIKLQGHNNFVKFRNIWLVELDGDR